MAQSLVDLWNTAREFIEEKTIEQIIRMTGKGKLLNNSDTSYQFREYLRLIASKSIIGYVSECLQEQKFDQRGLVLQDLVNEIGRRLSFEVENGLYQGTKNDLGFDGIWRSHDGDIVVEVKTTDTYTIDLDVLAGYRDELITTNAIRTELSVLIVVGKQNTASIEEQLRGSRHAWDMRLISVDGLIKLMKLKERVDDTHILRKIYEILTPKEFTRVDGIIDIVFDTAERLEETIAPESDDVRNNYVTELPPSEPQSPQYFHDTCIKIVSNQLQVPLTKQSRSTYTSPDHNIVVSCATSKEYKRPNSLYWFAFHPAQKVHLENSPTAFVSFGCGSPETIFLFPREALFSWLDRLNQTHADDGRYYWHIQITKKPDGEWLLLCKSGYDHIEISEYLI